MLPQEAVIINPARSALIEDDALIAALENGYIATAGLDYFKVERSGSPAFATYENMIMLLYTTVRDGRPAMRSAFLNLIALMPSMRVPLPDVTFAGHGWTGYDLIFFSVLAVWQWVRSYGQPANVQPL